MSHSIEDSSVRRLCVTFSHLHPEQQQQESSALFSATQPLQFSATAGATQSRQSSGSTGATGAQQRCCETGKVCAKCLTAQQLSAATPSSYKTFTPQQQKILLEKYLWDDVHIDFRKKVLEWVCRPDVAARLNVSAMDSIGHDQSKMFPIADRIGKEVLAQNFIDGMASVTDPQKIFSLTESVICDFSAATKAQIAYGMYAPMLAQVGTERHKRWIDELPRNLGCFMMSEVGHGSDVRGVQTTVTYDRSTKEFVVNTPNEEAQKCWAGNSYFSSKSGILFAQLVVDGKPRGVHAFVVDLRDDKGNVLPGIKIKYVGMKAAMHGLDQGRIWFDNARIPRVCLLNRYADVTEDGEYVTSIKNPGQLFAKHISALLVARLGVASNSVTFSKLGLTVATRYVFNRKQFGPDARTEVPIVFHQNTRNTLMPLIASTYANAYFANLAKRIYASGKEDPKTVHLFAAAAKAYNTADSLALLSSCRELCGGQGYLQRNGICLWRAIQDSYVTLDGVTPVLLQQIAQVLLATLQAAHAGQSTPKDFVEMHHRATTFHDNMMQKLHNNTEPDHIRSAEFILGALAYRTHEQLRSLGKQLHNEVKKHHGNEFEAFNECQVDAQELARSFCEMNIAEQFARVLTTMEKNLEGGTSNPIYKSHKIMFTLYGLKKISSCTFFLERDALTGKKFKAIKDQVDTLCRELVPYALALVDAFSLPEFIFDKTIASKKYSVGELMAFDNNDPAVYQAG